VVKFFIESRDLWQAIFFTIIMCNFIIFSLSKFSSIKAVHNFHQQVSGLGHQTMTGSAFSVCIQYEILYFYNAYYMSHLLITYSISICPIMQNMQ